MFDKIYYNELFLVEINLNFQKKILFPPPSVEVQPEIEPIQVDIKKPTRPEDIEEISDEEAEWSDEGKITSNYKLLGLKKCLFEICPA